MNLKIVAGHAIRWLLIMAASCTLFVTLFSSSSLRIDQTVRKALNMFEVPFAPITERIKTGQGYELLQIVDKEHGLYHHLFVKKTLGLFWSYRGGGGGRPLDEHTVLEFLWGYSTFGKYRHYYAAGPVNDARIAKLKIMWWDGHEQEADINNGTYIAARSYRIPKEEPEGTSHNHLYAYDVNGVLLYELSDDNRAIKKEG
ncbi:hypothetical protein [Paenibacillus sinopodophylli]|uniref:hypothetical protein n=1 Tax=Paenibacillus sinopodophylli TaxID=1837342 RepID=UPI00110CFD93|nr:hypothetical protein [Paenibacillus sinopodophylli]